jgi:hypothetical protein
MRQPRALRTGLQAVKTLRRVLWQQQSLETAFEHSKTALPAYEHGTLRDLCSGTLRHWHHYAAVIESLAPPAASDDARLLMATTLYEGEVVRSSPSTRASRAKLVARAEACCEALQLPQERQAVREVCSRALALTPQDRQALHTAASALSLPEWLHTRLAAETPLPSYGELLLRRPDFLALCAEPSACMLPLSRLDRNLSLTLALPAWSRCVEPGVWGRDQYAALLRERGHEASPSEV